MSTYTLSIETDAGTYQHGYHLGTIESTARAMAEHVFDSYTPRQGTVIRTVALKLDGKMVDCYDGKWSSESYQDVLDELAAADGAILQWQASARAKAACEAGVVTIDEYDLMVHPDAIKVAEGAYEMPNKI